MSERARVLPELVIATSNPGKLLEFRAILGDLPISLCALDAFPQVAMPEEGDDYRENAVAKARAAAQGTGRAALGDDSGLEVEALGGRPGPHSARYGGPGLSDGERLARLLAELEGIPEERRGARFVCSAALVLTDGSLHTATGICAGRVRTEAAGVGGFGYDPIFQPREHRVTMAELSPSDKNRISHRARAVAALVPAIREHLLGGDGGSV